VAWLLWAQIIRLLALHAHVVLGGGDFGAGVWDLLARGPRAERKRAAIAEGIGPIWEANHVRLILVIVLLFRGFPPAYAHLSITLHIPLSLMLFGIVLRGSAVTLRAYDASNSPEQRHWGGIFSVASTVTPVLLGVCVGAVDAGALALPPGGTFADRYVLPWLTRFTLASGAMTLAVFAFLAAIYLAVEARETDLQEDFRRMALGAIGALLRRRYRLARAAAVLQVSALRWGWGYVQFPWMIPVCTPSRVPRRRW
jgi:cytochrome bd ubiquinol oxidase subunit II